MIFSDIGAKKLILHAFYTSFWLYSIDNVVVVKEMVVLCPDIIGSSAI